MLETLQQIIYFFGHGLCHQYPSRSLSAGGLYFGVCARDTGIFLGLALTVGVICLFYACARVKPSGMPRLATVVCCLLLILPMALDGLSSYVGLRATNNLIRYITGYLCGSGVGVLTSPAVLDFWRSHDPGLPVLANPVSLVSVLITSLALGALFYLGYPAIGIVAPLLLLAVELAVFTGINLLIIRPIWASRQNRRATEKTGHRLFAAMLLPVILAIILAVVETAALSLVASALTLLFPWYVHL